MAVMQGTARHGLTRADLDALPDDGLRHELIDGAFVMTPAPGLPHQHLVYRLHRLLEDAVAGTGLYVAGAPFDVVLGPNVVEPDLLVAPRVAFTNRDLPSAPLLVVEVRSPSTAWLDEGRKRQLYAQSGVRHYWLVDPVAPTIELLELHDGEYEQVGRVAGSYPVAVQRPFPITLVASELGLPPD